MTAQRTDAIARLAGPATVIADHSCPGTSTTVLRLRTPGGSQLILKTNTNEETFRRELYALTHWAPALHPHAPRLLDADEEQRHLLMTAVAGQSVNTLSLPPGEARQVYRQAGWLMRALHEAALPTVLIDALPTSGTSSPTAPNLLPPRRPRSPSRLLSCSRNSSPGPPFPPTSTSPPATSCGNQAYPLHGHPSLASSTSKPAATRPPAATSCASPSGPCGSITTSATHSSAATDATRPPRSTT
ncbi:phosphotransferase [Streptomyces roseifaciens]|uniref:phosphotransferase n=1 Tax=Streptomyces roseifaciens TaxID=1488406 RepID=UPI000A97318B